jgi:hypothetical protein
MRIYAIVLVNVVCLVRGYQAGSMTNTLTCNKVRVRRQSQSRFARFSHSTTEYIFQWQLVAVLTERRKLYIVSSQQAIDIVQIFHLNDVL